MLKIEDKMCYHIWISMYLQENSVKSDNYKSTHYLQIKLITFIYLTYNFFELLDAELVDS